MHKSISFVLAVLCCSLAFCRPPRHYFFTHYTTASGLISHQVNNMLQDKQGFVWIGTNDGLQRFDGIHYKTFQHNATDTTSLPSNIIWQLMEDGPGHLWILFLDGHVGTFNTSTFRYTGFSINSANFQQANSGGRKLIADDRGNTFLLLTGIELLRFDRNQHRFTPMPAALFPPDMKIQAFAPEPGTHRYWFATKEKGPGIYDAALNTVCDAAANPCHEKAIDILQQHHAIEQLYIDKKKRLWIVDKPASIPELGCYDIAAGKTVLTAYHFDEKKLGYHEASRFFEQQDGTVWVTGLQLFARYLEPEKEFEQVYNGYEGEHGIDYVQITTLFEDREHSMWAGTANNGIFRFNPSKEFFNNIGYTSHTTGQQGNNAPCSFTTDRDGSLLVAIREDGLYRFNKNMEQVPLAVTGIADNNKLFIWDLCRSADSATVWMGTQQGLYKYNAQKKSATFIHLQTLQDNKVRRIAAMPSGDLWMGTETGLFRWSAQEGKSSFASGMHASALLPATRINKIMIDRKGLAWIATAGHGVYVIDPVPDSVLFHFDNKAGAGFLQLPEPTAASVYDFNDSLVVIATSGRLLLFNRRSNKSVLLPRPLSGFIAAIEKDQTGFLWVSTTTSIYRVTVEKKIVQRFDRNDGLANDFFMAGASVVLPDKKMIFGMYGGMTVFLPTAIATAPLYPDLRITEIMLKDRSLNTDSLLAKQTIRLAANENALQFAVSPLSYNSGYLIKYKLDGLDNDFRNIDPDYQLHYSYIPPGSYSLLVKTFDATGKEGSKHLEISISVAAPFWKTWWFYSLLFLSGLYILYAVDRQRTRRRVALTNMRSKIADGLNSDIHTALGHINILSELASIKAENEPVKSKEFISQINVKSSQMLTAMDDMLWSISPENDSMDRVLERIRELVDEMVNRNECRISLRMDDVFPQTQADMQARHDVYLLFRDTMKGLIKNGITAMDIRIWSDKLLLVYEFSFANNGHFAPDHLLGQLEHSPQAAARSAVIHQHDDGPRSTIRISMKLS